ncbi:sensor histidine kinase [Stenotrophomonas forensis]|uniref:sensor histidine kinase n=1 Tax=Stenotrophomonas forensis TaxID=2871169 RepID=UPI0039C5C25B
MRLAYENRILLISLCVGLPGAAIGILSTWHLPISLYPRILLTVAILATVAGAALFVRHSILHHILTLFSLIEALRCGDYRLRGRHTRGKAELSGLYLSLNGLAGRMQEERLATEEARRLLDAVLVNIDVAIMAFDQRQQLRLANPAALQLLGLSSAEALGRDAQTLRVAPLLQQDSALGVLDYDFPAASGTWRIDRDAHLEGSKCVQLLFIADLRAVLRAEELRAWKRMTRVLGHEVNNSLAPIASMSSSLQSLLLGTDMREELRQDVDAGLTLIHNRSQHLRSFIRRYAEVARLPRPNGVLADLVGVLGGLPRLMNDAFLFLSVPPHPVQMFLDPDQMEQALINLLKNAREASPSASSPIRLICTEEKARCVIQIIDQGQGVANPVNLFVPFYSTKKHGSGIGLVLSRQIAEAHGGTLRLYNQTISTGCIAELILPKPLFARDAALVDPRALDAVRVHAAD